MPNENNRKIITTLPGEKKADQTLINSAVQEINRIYVVGGLQTVLQIGEYLLQTFFNGKPANFREKEKKHVSLGHNGASGLFLVGCMFNQLPMYGAANTKAGVRSRVLPNNSTT